MFGRIWTTASRKAAIVLNTTAGTTTNPKLCFVVLPFPKRSLSGFGRSLKVGAKHHRYPNVDRRGHLRPSKAEDSKNLRRPIAACRRISQVGTGYRYFASLGQKVFSSLYRFISLPKFRSRRIGEIRIHIIDSEEMFHIARSLSVY